MTAPRACRPWCSTHRLRILLSCRAPDCRRRGSRMRSKSCGATGAKVGSGIASRRRRAPNAVISRPPSPSTRSGPSRSSGRLRGASSSSTRTTRTCVTSPNRECSLLSSTPRTSATSCACYTDRMVLGLEQDAPTVPMFQPPQEIWEEYNRSNADDLAADLEAQARRLDDTGTRHGAVRAGRASW